MLQEIKMFSKLLTDTDIKRRLAIPVKILSSLPDFNGSHAVTIPVVYGTRVWPIVCSVRKTGQKKPVFSVGWRNFVIRNDFHVGDQLTMYKVQDEAGSFHYRVEVEKPVTPCVALSARSLSLNHELEEETTGTSRAKISNFEHEQEHVVTKQEGAIMELVDAAADAPVPFVDHHVIARPPCKIFANIGLSDEATTKALSKPKHETEMKLHACYMTKEERDIKATYGTSQADAEAYSKSTGRLRLDLVLGQPSPYDREVNLDLTLGCPLHGHSKP